MADPCVRVGIASAARCGAVAEHFRRNNTSWVPRLIVDLPFGLADDHPPPPATEAIRTSFRAFQDQFGCDSGRVHYPLDSVSVGALRRQPRGAMDSLGTVAAGKLADLVLLEANPLADITNTQRIGAVVANGRYFDRAELDRLLQAGWDLNKP